MLLQGMEGGWVAIEASHTVSSGLNVTCHMLNIIFLQHSKIYVIIYVRYSPTTTSHYHTLLHVSTHGYTERAFVPHVMWLRVPRPRPTLSCNSMRGN